MTERFYKDLMAFGCLKGFKHISVYLRGREELLLRVHNYDHGQASEVTEYLIGCYARYQRPYVWIRSHFDRCKVRFGNRLEETDMPLRLLSTSSAQHEKGSEMYLIVEELVQINSALDIANPFELDRPYLTSLAFHEAALLTAALIQFLKARFTDPACSYPPSLGEDLQWLTAYHFETMQRFLSVHKSRSNVSKPQQ